MRNLFVDTAYWVALLNPKDDLHHKANQLSESLHSTRLVTTDMVLTELLNDFSSRGSHYRKIALNLIRTIKSHPNIEIIPLTTELFESGLELYEMYSDKEWSLTDCISFKVMERHNIAEALTHDKHFQQAGFMALMRNFQD